jgi:hypothetical protein
VDGIPIPHHRQAAAVARDFMRASLIAILIFLTSFLFAQSDFRLDTSRIALDSMFTDLIDQSKVLYKHGIVIAIAERKFKTIIKNYDNDSISIMFYNGGGGLLFKQFNKYDKTKCRWWETAEFYDLAGRLIYWKALKWSCMKASDKTDPEVKYFDALLYEKQRYRYDSLGRLLERVWWYAPIDGVRKYSYTYDSKNRQSFILTKYDEALFWE